MTSNNIVIADVCYCGHKRNSHFMGGPCYFPYVFDSNNSNTSSLEPRATTTDNGPFNKSKKCDCKEHRSDAQALV